MVIRTATGLDQQKIQDIYRSAFPAEERDIVAELAVNLLSQDTTPSILSFTAETEDVITGHIAFSPVMLPDNSPCQGYILAPLAVATDHQKQGIGSALVKHGIQQLTQQSIDFLLVYGDPKYYGRFGFSETTAKPYIPPYDLQYPFGWQGLMLSERPAAKSPLQITCVPALCDPAMW